MCHVNRYILAHDITHIFILPMADDMDNTCMARQMIMAYDLLSLNTNLQGQSDYSSNISFCEETNLWLEHLA